MRILHVLDHSLPLQSGYVTRSLGIIRSQRTHGWQTVHLTTPRHSAPSEPLEVLDGLKFFRTPIVATTTPVLREFLEMRATRRRLMRIVAQEKPDIIPALSVGRRFGLPVVYEVRALWEDAAVDHGTTSEGGWRYRLSRRIACATASLRRAWVYRGIGEKRRSPTRGYTSLHPIALVRRPTCHAVYQLQAAIRVAPHQSPSNCALMR